MEKCFLCQTPVDARITTLITSREDTVRTHHEYTARLTAQLAQVTQQRDMLREALAELYNLTQNYCDEGPRGEEWPSKELEAARAKTRAALAATQPKESK
jgi:hypothetical protein